MRNPARRFALLALFVIASVAAFGLGVVLGPQAGRPAAAQSAPSAQMAESREDVVLTAGTFRRIADRTQPAVVSIATTQRIARQGAGNENPDDFFDWFFSPRRRRLPDQFKETIGSGLIISPDGEILTNHHVVENAREVLVTLNDGREFSAEVVGVDPETDVALIQIKASDLPVLRFGDSDGLDVGDWVMAIGNPFQFGFSVTVGVVSAKAREINVGPYDDFIQTDAAINPGNSGGPLLDLTGRVVGINTAIISGGFRQSAGVGFAIPSDLVQEILPQLREKGRVDRGYLGVVPQDLTEEIARGLDLEDTKGAIITQVDPNTPASEADLRTYDVILTWNGKQVLDSRHLRRLVAATGPGKKATVGILREGRRKNVTLRVVQRNAMVRGVPSGQRSQPSDELGMEIQNITPALAERLGLAVTTGVIVTAVDDASIAERAGLQRGDVILEVDQKPVDSIRDFAQHIDAAAGGNSLLRVKRGRTSFLITVRVPR